jgi:hypothetical protein
MSAHISEGQDVIGEERESKRKTEAGSNFILFIRSQMSSINRQFQKGGDHVRRNGKRLFYEFVLEICVWERCHPVLERHCAYGNPGFLHSGFRYDFTKHASPSGRCERYLCGKPGCLPEVD